GGLTDGDLMCAARGSHQGDVCHPRSAPGAPPHHSPPPETHSPRSLGGGAAAGDPPGHLTQPSPRALPQGHLPGRLTRLGRSPEAEMPERVWTVRGEARGAAGPDQVIITDICLNHKPELALNTSCVRPQHLQQQHLQQLSVADLQKQVGRVPYDQRHLLQQAPLPSTQQEAQQEGCSLLGAARAFLGHLLTLVRSGAVCARTRTQQNGVGEAGPSAGESQQRAGAVGRPASQQQQQTLTQVTRLRATPSLSTPGRVVARRSVTPEPPKTPEIEVKVTESPWVALGQLVRLQHESRPPSTSADPVYLSPETTSTLQPSPESGGGLRAVHSLLDIQRDRERTHLHPTRYLDDLRVLYNIHRRELVSQLVYREAGQIFQREGGAGEPRPMRKVVGTPDPLVPKEDLRTRESKQRLFRKIASLRPVVAPRVAEPEPCWGDSEFIRSCLRAHNIYRARHSAAPLRLSSELCRQAQAWVNHLAHTGTFRHRGQPGLGENLFCRNTALILRGRTSVMPDIAGEEVAAYWYSSVRQYKFNKPQNVLQASQGPFTQMVWQESQEFGVGRARSRSGKIIVVAHYTPAGNIEHAFKENVLPLNTRALAAEILGELPGVTSLEEVDGRAAERAMGLLAAQPPRLTGRNATKVIAAHLLGHTASLITTPDEELQVVINRCASLGREARKRASSRVNPAGVSSSLSIIPEASCCPPKFRLRTRASVSPADIQSSVIHETSEGDGGDEEAASRHWLQPHSSQVGDGEHTEVIELKRGDLGTPSSDLDAVSFLGLSPKGSSNTKRSRFGRDTGRWVDGTNSESSDPDAIRSESFDSVDSESHPEPTLPSSWRENGGKEEPHSNQSDDQTQPGVDKHNIDLKLPFEIPDAEHGRLNYYALSPMRY
ncbi:hypothetical protein OTU49_006400, partial [Cherax quadricarinatus]